MPSFKDVVPYVRENFPDCEDPEGATGEFIEGTHYESCDDFRFFPGGPRLFSENGTDYINLWTGWNAEPGDITPFLELTQHTFASSPKDIEWLLDLIAWHVQNPMVHIPFAGAITGERLPADLWVSAIYEAFAPWSIKFGIIHLRSTNKAWMRNAVIGVLNGTGNGLEDRIGGQVLCQMILSPDARVIHDAQRQRSFSRNEVSRMLVLLTLPKGQDRLLQNDDLFYSIPARKCPPEVISRFHEWVNDGNARFLADWFLKRDVSQFVVPAAAPLTQASRVASRERMKPFARLAHEMQESKENYIAHWISDALTWASEMTMPTSSASKATQEYAKTILRTFPDVTVRPWYTSDEITLMFPDLFSQYPEIKRWNGVSPSLVSNDLRAGGLPMLAPDNGSAGFLHNGRLNNYFVVFDQEKWLKPISQEEFEKQMKAWPTYRKYVEGKK